jgi:hypothetical protein
MSQKTKKAQQNSKGKKNMQPKTEQLIQKGLTFGLLSRIIDNGMFYSDNFARWLKKLNVSIQEVSDIAQYWGITVPNGLDVSSHYGYDTVGNIVALPQKHQKIAAVIKPLLLPRTTKSVYAEFSVEISEG